MQSVTQSQTSRKPQTKPTIKPKAQAKAKAQAVAIPTITDEQTFSIKAAATACHCGTATIWRAIENGKLATYRTGAKRLIMGHQLLSWLNNGGETLTAEEKEVVKQKAALRSK